MWRSCSKRSARSCCWLGCCFVSRLRSVPSVDRYGRRAYQVLRESFGGVILLGIEILVAADLVRTVAVATTLENVVILGLIVLIRTVLSFSLEIEIEGVAPWRRAMVGGASRIRQAAAKAGTEGEGPV